MIAAGEEGSLVSLICDSGERYTATYYNDTWLQSNNITQKSCSIFYPPVRFAFKHSHANLNI